MISLIPGFGSSSCDVSGSNCNGVSLRNSFFTIGGPSVVCHTVEFCQGDGSSCFEEGRDIAQEEQSCQPSGSSSCQSRCPFAQKETTLSSKAQRRGSCSKAVKPDDEVISAGSLGNAMPNASNLDFAFCTDRRSPPLHSDDELPNVAALPSRVDRKSSLSISRWCSMLVTSVFRCRASFSQFVRHAISLHRDDKSSGSSVFPLPLPFVGVFAKMPLGLSSARRAKVHFRRAVTIIVLALNFWWNDSHFVTDDCLRRIQILHNGRFLTGLDICYRLTALLRSSAW